MGKAKRTRPARKARSRATTFDATVTYLDRGGKFMVLAYKDSSPPVTVLFEVKDGGRFEQLEAWNFDLKPEQALEWHRNRMSLVIAGTAIGPALLSAKGLKELMRRAKAAGGKA